MKYYIAEIRLERRAREGNVWAQSTVAKQIGVPCSRMRAIEEGRIKPTKQQLSDIATYFGLSVRELSLPPKRKAAIKPWMTLDTVCRVFNITRKHAYHCVKRKIWTTEQRGARVYVRTKDIKR